MKNDKNTAQGFDVIENDRFLTYSEFPVSGWSVSYDKVDKKLTVDSEFKLNHKKATELRNALDLMIQKMWGNS